MGFTDSKIRKIITIEPSSFILSWQFHNPFDSESCLSSHELNSYWPILFLYQMINTHLRVNGLRFFVIDCSLLFIKFSASMLWILILFLVEFTTIFALFLLEPTAPIKFTRKLMRYKCLTPFNQRQWEIIASYSIFFVWLTKKLIKREVNACIITIDPYAMDF